MRHDTMADVGLKYHDERRNPGLHNKRDDDVVARKLGVDTLAPLAICSRYYITCSSSEPGLE